MSYLLPTLITIFVLYFIYANRRRETLYVHIDSNNVNFILTDDLYMSAKLNDLPFEDIEENIKYLLSKRAFELKNLIDNIIIINHHNSSEEYNHQEFLDLIKSSSSKSYDSKAA